MNDGGSAEKRTVTADAADDGKRLDVFLREAFPEKSRSFFSNLIEQQNVTVNGSLRKDSFRISEGDLVEVSFPEVRDTEILPQDIPLDILYEDDDLLVVNKPKGMVVHPSCGHSDETLVNALIYHCGDSLSGINGEKRPGIVHRIDRDTTGSLIVCKNDAAHASIAKQIKDHSVKRLYEGIVTGNIKEDEGTVDKPLARDRNDRKKVAVVPEGEGRRAVTHFKVLERFGEYTYTEFALETGRTHQIRVHMAYIKHPILGDPVYGPKKCPFSLEGQTLHAKTIGFIHPGTGKYMEFSAPLPEYFEKLLKRFRKQ